MEMVGGEFLSLPLLQGLFGFPLRGLVDGFFLVDG